jgi:hypothetical protein
MSGLGTNVQLVAMTTILATRYVNEFFQNKDMKPPKMYDYKLVFLKMVLKRQKSIQLL